MKAYLKYLVEGFIKKEILVINIYKIVTRRIKCEKNHVTKILKDTRFVIEK